MLKTLYFVIPGNFASWNDYNKMAGRSRWKQAAFEAGWKDYAEWHIWHGIEQADLDQLPLGQPVRVVVRVWRANKLRRDLPNIFLKPVFDACTEVGLWPDDNEFVNPELTLIYMGVDKANPRAEFSLERMENDNP